MSVRPGAGGVLGRDQPDFYNNLWAGNLDAARACGDKDRYLMQRWYNQDLTGKFGSGPAILKAALNARGQAGGHVRAPLMDIGPEGRAMVEEDLRTLGYI